MPWQLLFVALILLGYPLRAESPPAAGQPLPQRYLAVYLKIKDADQLQKSGDYQEALRVFKDAYIGLARIHELDPEWEKALVIQRLNDCRQRIIDLTAKVAENPASSPPANASSLPGAAGPAGNFVLLNFSQEPRTAYPWKKDIIASIFWIGEDAKDGSAWDRNWKQHNDGEDTPENREGYFPAGHPSTLNPFYVALPFNDLAYPAKAEKWLPVGWQRPAVAGKPVSSCKDRWVEIKSAKGQTCYAQWEDVGPLRNDHAEYVFGTEQPVPGHPGLCVSPAVDNYLNLSGEAKPSIVSWRFVSDKDVPPGYWLKYDEQALIFSAMHQQKNVPFPGH